MGDSIFDPKCAGLRSRLTYMQVTALRKVALAFLLFIFSFLGMYFSVASGLLLVLMCGALVRTILLGNPHWNPRLPDHLLTGFTESFMFSALLLAPLAYIGPFLFGQVNFLVMVFIITVLLTCIGSYLRHDESSETLEGKAGGDKERGFPAVSAWIVVLLWLSLGVLDLAYSFHMYYGSFSDTFFMFGDLTNNLTIIQSIATGVYPPPNLTFFGSTLSENPIALTLSLGYTAILMATMNLQGYGDIFIIVVKMVMHSAVVPVIYYAVRSISEKIPGWIMVISTLGLGVTMDLAPLFRFLGVYDDGLNYTVTNEINRGVSFPWDRPDGVPADFFVPGLGYESFLASFHHLLPLLFFVFIIALLFRVTNWKGGATIAIAVSIVELPFFHIGLGFFPLVSVGIFFVGIVLLRPISRSRMCQRLLLYKALIFIGVVGLFLIRSVVSSLVVITPRFTGTAILNGLGTYLGPFVFLGLIGYIALHSLPDSPGKWLSIVWLEFTLLSTILFSMARDSGIGYMPTDYFPLFNLQTSVLLAFALGVSYWSSNKNDALQLLERSFGSQNWWRNLKQSDQRMKLQKESIVRHAPKAIAAGKMIFILSLLLLGSLQTSWFYQYNLGEFNENFYGTVPKVTLEERSMLRWIYENSEPDEVVLCAPENWELSAIIGRQILYSGYRVANASDPRYQAYFAMYNATAMDEVMDLFLEYEVSLVLFTPTEFNLFPHGYSKFESSPFLILVYSEGQYLVFKMKVSEM
ncbi:MAG: hypothetical protein EAX81_01330 [Candidatus Thorarchaeota archaeon]|nr:hypothetical protein [Candidatus Thorarchaeota archaeon]